MLTKSDFIVCSNLGRFVNCHLLLNYVGASKNSMQGKIFVDFVRCYAWHYFKMYSVYYLTEAQSDVLHACIV